jgi:hypothetical protein
MKVIKFPDGTTKEIIKEDGRFYITEDAQYRKLYCAEYTIEEVKEEQKPAPKKSAKKKSAEKE